MEAITFDITKRTLQLMTVGLFVVVIGCGGNIFESLADDNSKEAKFEDALIALDEGDYQDAVNAFKELLAEDPDNVEVKTKLASAYMGLAGLDAINIINIASEQADNNTEAGFDTFSTLLPDPSDSGNAVNMHEAVRLLAETKSAQSAEEDDNTSLMLAVAAASDLVLTLETNFDVNFDDTTGEPSYIPDIDTVENDLDDASTGGETTLNVVAQDIVYITQGAAGAVSSVAGEDAEKEVLADLNEITSDIERDGTAGTSATELVNFLTTLQ